MQEGQQHPKDHQKQPYKCKIRCKTTRTYRANLRLEAADGMGTDGHRWAPMGTYQGGSVGMGTDGHRERPPGPKAETGWSTD